MLRLMRLILVAFIGVVAAAPAMAHGPALIKSIQLPQSLGFCQEPVPIQLDHVRERYEKEMLLTLWDRPQVLLWLKRSQRYLPIIAQQLKAAQMPEDLKYVAIVESALRPHAGSAKGAIGFWQLLPETARNHGLRVDQFVDQRRELRASTQAALSYLKALHDKFSSWTLAVAAYNMGEEGLAAEILEQNTRDYYKLYLSLETQRFVFRVLAVKLIISEPGAFGFELRPEDYYKPLAFDTVTVDSFQEVPLRLVAEAAGTYFKNIKDLNPHLRGHYLQAGHHQLYLPQGSAKGFAERFQALVAQYTNERQHRIYVVKSGDSLSTIADKFDVPLAAIMIWNRIDIHQTIHPGDRLVIYPRQLRQIKP